MKKVLFTLVASISLLFSLSLAKADEAQINLNNNQTKAPLSAANMISIIPSAPTLSARGYVLMDADTGKILAQNNMNERMAPASLTKLMTLFLTFQALENGQIKLDDKIRIDPQAWRMGGSRMFIKAGTDVTVEQLIQGVIVASGNDACVALAQYITGTEQTFVQLMNETALRLGMKDTHYMDATGLPDPKQYSSPHDMAVLTRALINSFPGYYHYFSQKWISFNNIKQPNRNRLLWRDPTVDGLKTGFTDAAGYCLVASAKRDGMRLIAVVMGEPSESARANNALGLLNYGFRFYKTYKLFDANQPITKRRVIQGQEKYAMLGITQPLFITIPPAQYKSLKATVNLQGQLSAPIKMGQTYGEVKIMMNDQVVASAPLVSLQNVSKGGFFSRLIDKMTSFIKS